MRKSDTPLQSQPSVKKYRSAADPVPAEPKKVYKGGKTIPDQSMSVREILHRYTTGQDLSVNHNVPVYLENVRLYDTRRKSNIDLAVDRHINEQEIEQHKSDIYAKELEKKELKAKTAREQAEKTASLAANAAVSRNASPTGVHQQPNGS